MCPIELSYGVEGALLSGPFICRQLACQANRGAAAAARGEAAAALTASRSIPGMKRLVTASTDELKAVMAATVREPPSLRAPRPRGVLPNPRKCEAATPFSSGSEGGGAGQGIIREVGAGRHREPLGPGRGEWAFASAASQGLIEAELERAEILANAEMGDDRLCYMVIKNGFVVYEHYRREHTPSSLNTAWSTTKSLCASLFGVAVEQGWANPADRVAARNADMRECNPDSTFRNVLTMTGQSEDLNNPSFNYDGSVSNRSNCILHSRMTHPHSRSIQACSHGLFV